MVAQRAERLWMGVPPSRNTTVGRQATRVAALALLTLVGALGSSGMTAPAAKADATITATPQQVQAALFAAGGVGPFSIGAGAVSAKHAVANQLGQATLQQLYLTDPNTSATDGAALVKWYVSQLDTFGTSANPDDRLQSLSNQCDVSQTSLSAACSALYVRESDDAARVALNPPPSVVQLPLLDLRTVEPRLAITIGEGTMTVLNDASGLSANGDLTSDPAAPTPTLVDATAPASGLAYSANMAQQNPAFADAWNQVFSQAAGENITDSPAQLVADNPVLQSPPVAAVTSSLGSNGSLSTTESGLMSLANQDLLGIGSLTLNTQQPGTTKTQGDTNATTIKNATAAVDLLGGLVGLVDKQAGTDIKTVGDAVTSVASAFNAWSQATQAVGALTSIGGGLATAALTGNIFSAVSSIVGLFVHTPSATDLILQQLGALKKDLDQFEQQTASHLDQIDKEINKLYVGLSTQIAALSTQIQAQSVETKQIYDAITKLQEQLDALQANLWQQVYDASGEGLWTAINAALGYRARTGNQLSAAEFNNAESTFYTWATHAATTFALAPPAPFDADSVGGFLPSYPLDSEVDFLRQFPALGLSPALPALGGQTLPNPHDWTLASEAESQLLLENPSYVTQGVLDRLSTLQQEGQTLNAALSAIAKRDVPGVGSGNSLLNALIANYDYWGAGGTLPSALACPSGAPSDQSLAQLLKGAENCYLSKLQSAPGVQSASGGSLNVNLWGGPEQSPPAVPSVPCASVDGWNVGTPSNAAMASMVPNAYLLAESIPTTGTNNGVAGNALFGGQLTLHCSAAWANVTSKCVQKSPDGGCTYASAGDIAVQFSWYYAGAGTSNLTSISTLDYTTPFQVGCGTDGVPRCSDDASAAAQAIWNTPSANDSSHLSLLQHVQQSGTITQAANTPPIEGAVSDWLNQQQQALYQAIASSQRAPDGSLMSQFGSLTSGPLHAAALRVGGAAALLNAYVSLGLAPALGDDDTLRSLLLGSEYPGADAVDQLQALYSSLEPGSSDSTLYAADLVNAKASDLTTELATVLDDVPTGAPAVAAAKNPPPPPTTSATPIDETSPLIGAMLDRLDLTHQLLSWTLDNPTTPSGSTDTPSGSIDAPSGSTDAPSGSTQTSSGSTQVQAPSSSGRSGSGRNPMPENLGLKVSFGAAELHGATVAFRVSCLDSAGCQLSATLTVTERFRGSKLIAVTAGSRHRTKSMRRTVVVGSTSVSLGPGQANVMALTLNAAGKRLLSSRRRLTASLTVRSVGGASLLLLAERVTLRASRKR